MRQELTSHVCDFFVLHVVLDSIVEVDWIDVSQFHVVNADAVVSESLSVNISDGPANLQEFLVLRNGLFEFSKVVIEDPSAIVGPAFIPGLACSFASKSKDFVVFESLLSGDPIVRVRVTHGESGVVAHDVLGE